MKVFILLSIVVGAFAVRDCPANQHYESCGTACPLTCDNYDDPPRACVLMCNPGCHCDEGYVKTEDGECVLPENCPNRANEVCGENERFLGCGTACPLTCDNYQNPPKFCTLQCVIGCACEEGYVKNSEGRCVLPENCPNRANEVCGENERFLGCGTACPLTCDNYENPPKICTLQCVIGCACEEGYVKTSDGRCVLPENCPSRANEVCGRNEQYNGCGTACPLTCKNYRNPPKICTAQCVIGCECQKGYVKSYDGRCVLPFNCPVNSEEENCLAEPDEGMCRGYFPMFHYDVKSGTCKEFIYGGCQGNGNRYGSEEECLENCGGVKQSSSDVCSLPSETGMCRGFFPRYYFNKASGQCEKFVYGGCGGNENNFGTQEDCQKSCGNSANGVCGENEKYTTCGTACPLTCDNYQNPPRVCTLQCVIGCQCAKGYLKTADGRCVLPENCPTRSIQSALDRPDCDKAPEVGVCRARIPRFYYDQQAGMCKTFIYGGCGGNRNNFESEFDCLNKCGALASSGNAVCEQEKVVGPCKAYFPRYYFNKQTGECEKFIYGGCGGNENNFGRKDACEATCVALASSGNDVCEQEKVVGPCRAAFPRYYFNKQTGQCEKFIYGGCMGNDNNFERKDACEATCVV